jgi:hypothetical protein
LTFQRSISTPPSELNSKKRTDKLKAKQNRTGRADLIQAGPSMKETVREAVEE